MSKIDIRSYIKCSVNNMFAYMSYLRVLIKKKIILFNLKCIHNIFFKIYNDRNQRKIQPPVRVKKLVE